MELYLQNKNIDYYLFEPTPSTYQRLLQTVSLNRGTHPCNMGMSNEKGSFSFYLPGESEAASLRSVEDACYRKRSDGYGKYLGSSNMDQVTFQISTIDAFVLEQSIDGLGFLKTDVEGNEKYVLEGARETIQKFQPLVYTELLGKHTKRFGYHPNEVIQFMWEFG